MKWLHGSPSSKLSLSDRPLYVTQDRDVAKSYALGNTFFASRVVKDVPTIYTLEVTTKNICDFRRSEHRSKYDELRTVWNAAHDDPDEKLPKSTSMGFISNKTGLPSYGTTLQLREMFDGMFDAMYVDEANQGISLLLFKASRSARIVNKEHIVNSAKTLAQRGEPVDIDTLVKRHFDKVNVERQGKEYIVIPSMRPNMSKMSGFITEIKKLGMNAKWDGKAFIVASPVDYAARLERLRIRRGDPVGTDYSNLLPKNKMVKVQALMSRSVYHVLSRFYKTINPFGSVSAAPYGPNICHGIVARKVIERNHNPEDKIWLYGASGGDVMHSVLTDENDKILVDPWKNTDGFRWMGKQGYGKPGDMMDFLMVSPVGDLYDEFGM